MVLVGREDYIVRSLHAPSGQETWNATYGRVMQLNPLGGWRLAAFGGGWVAVGWQLGDSGVISFSGMRCAQCCVVVLSGASSVYFGLCGLLDYGVMLRLYLFLVRRAFPT